MSVLNLNKARKAKARKDKRAKADANAVKFGRTKAERTVEAKQSAKDVARLEAHRREP